MSATILAFLLLPHVQATLHAQDGTLDTNFGTGGRVTTDFPGQTALASGVALQADGKIVVAGVTFPDNGGDFALARYHQDGTLDATFGTGGQLTTDFNGFHDDAHGVAIQADGKIVAVGVGSQDFALARYNADGSLDASFGSGGLVLTDFGVLGAEPIDNAFAVAIQSDGRIVVAGETLDQTSATTNFAVARYLANGALDQSFGGDGRVVLPLSPGADTATSVAVQADGRIVVAGRAIGLTFEFDFALLRLNTDGSRDASFGGNGVVTTGFAPGEPDSVQGVAMQPDGRLVAAGVAHVEPGGRIGFALARYNVDGSLDATFGSGGKVITSIGRGIAVASAVALQADGKIVAAGGGGGDFLLARYATDGSLDTTFGVGGTVITDVAGVADDARAMTIQPDGRIVVAGSVFPGDFAVVRYDGPAPHELTLFLHEDDIPGTVASP